MFKNATIIGFNPRALQSRLGAWPVVADEFHFTPPLSNELERSGWSPVRDDVYCYSGVGMSDQFLLYFTVEKKHLPAGAVKLVVAEKAAAQAEAQGFPLGKVQRRELTERVRDELLPRALSSRSTTKVWIDRAAGRIVIDSCARSTVEAIQRLLIKSFGDIGLQDVTWPRAKTITQWVFDEPESFTLDDQITLQYPGERGKVIKFDRANLSEQDVLHHVQYGKATVKSVAMTFDDRISFVMTDGAQVRRIRALDILKEGREAEKDVDRFDNDFVLMTGELSRLVNALVAEA